MRLKSWLLALMVMLAASARAQQTKKGIVAEGGGVDDYASARVLYWDQQKDGAAGQFAINYGRPVWKKDYEDPAKFDGMTKGKVWRMGKNFWTTLDTSLPLKIAGKEVGVGTYYLGLHRSEDGSEWSLAFIEPARIRSSGLDAFEIQKAPIAFEAPMTTVKATKPVNRLTITLAYPKANPKKVTMKVAWGSLALSAPIEVALAE